jgi:glycerophosphoryl diester phosphodiesterase
VPTLAEVIEPAQTSRTCDGKPVGIYPGTKHPCYFDAIGLSMEEPLVALLRDQGYRGRGAPVFIQSFEVSNLQELNDMTQLRLAQLINCGGTPYDLASSGDVRTYADLVTPAGLDFVAGYADGIGPCKHVLIPRRNDGTLGEAAPRDRRRTRPGTDRARVDLPGREPVPSRAPLQHRPNAHGDMAAEVRAFVAAGMAGFFTDHPDQGAAALP